jgi:hypothetical protein
LPRCDAANVEALETVVNAAASNANNIISLLRMVSPLLFPGAVLYSLYLRVIKNPIRPDGFLGC